MSEVSLFRSVLGERSYATLPSELQRFHSQRGHVQLHGECDVVGAGSWPARAIARLARLPPAGRCEIAFTLDAQPHEERWTRRFGGHEMASTLRRRGALIEERLGPFALRMRPFAREGALALELEHVRLLGIPLPRALWPRMSATEHATPARLHFDIVAGMPLVGTLVEYRGWLSVAGLRAEG